LVVAHRGASSILAEHTLAAYQAALSGGADGLECDVRLSRDGHLVCVHDRKVNRTSNGTGVVSELDLSRLQKLDFESWHGRWPESADEELRDDPYLAGVAPDRDIRGGVLTLKTLLGLVADTGRPVRMLIETKHPTRYAGLVEKELVRTLSHFSLARSTLVGEPGPDAIRASLVSVDVMSFATTALRRVRLLAPDLPTVLLIDRLLPGRRAGELPTGVGIVGPSLAILRSNPDFVSRAQARGHKVYVWTVDRPEDVAYVLGLGVDAVISNDPAGAIQIRNRFTRVL
jgi:glycerophosphoryl diester phosphodiesterase